MSSPNTSLTCLGGVFGRGVEGEVALVDGAVVVGGAHLHVAGGEVAVEVGGVEGGGGREQPDGLLVVEEGALVVPALEELVPLLPQFLRHLREDGLVPVEHLGARPLQRPRLASPVVVAPAALAGAGGGPLLFQRRLPHPEPRKSESAAGNRRNPPPRRAASNPPTGRDPNPVDGREKAEEFFLPDPRKKGRKAGGQTAASS